MFTAPTELLVAATLLLGVTYWRGSVGNDSHVAVQLWKRNVSIRDDSGSSVEVTLWGGYAQEPGDALQEVRALICNLQSLR